MEAVKYTAIFAESRIRQTLKPGELIIKEADIVLFELNSMNKLQGQQKRLYPTQEPRKPWVNLVSFSLFYYNSGRLFVLVLFATTVFLCYCNFVNHL